MNSKHEFYRMARVNHFQNLTNYTNQRKSMKITPSETTGKAEKKSNKEMGKALLPFKIPMSYVVSGATELCSEAKCAKRFDRLDKLNRNDENYRLMVNKVKGQTSWDMTSTHISGENIEQSPDGCRKTRFQEQCIKRPRKQGCQTIRGRRTSTKRRPLSTSNQEIWFMNKDTTTAILSSQVIAQKVQKTSKAHTNIKSLSQVKNKPKLKNLVGNVPKFMSIPREFQELCKNKSVEQIMSSKLSGKDDSKPVKRISSNVTISPPERQPVQKWRNSIDQNLPSNQRQEIPKLESSSYSPFVRTYGGTENLQVPKNIYIRKESGGEIMEDLVEVRNQDELDVLNTMATLQLAHNKHSSRSGKRFEDLQDYEIYYYPVLRPSQAVLT